MTLLGLGMPVSATAQDLRIWFIDVGQGDAALIVTPEGRRALIDAGPNNGAVLSALNRLHVDTLDLVIASHNHADHIGGLPAVLQAVAVRFYMDNGVPATTQTYESVITAVESRQIKYLSATPRRIQLGSVTLLILPHDSTLGGQNNTSVGVLLKFGEFAALFTGDAEYAERDFWRDRAELPHVTVLKVSHHGSVNGTDSLWIAALRPKIAVISVGAENSYGHPALSTIRLLDQAGVIVYRTDQMGTILLQGSNSGRFHVVTYGATDSLVSSTAP